MVVLVSALALTVVTAALIVGYVAYPGRGRGAPDVPGARRLSTGMRWFVDSTGIDPDPEEAARGGALHELRDQGESPGTGQP